MKKTWNAVSRRQNMEVGILIALVILVLGRKDLSDFWLWLVVIDLGMVMLWPGFFKPLSWLWFGMAQVLNVVVSKALLTIVFFLLVVPVAQVRKWMGFDPLQLTGFKQSDRSVFYNRDYQFKKSDFKNTF